MNTVNNKTPGTLQDLSNSSISQTCETVKAFLTEGGTDHTEAVRITLMLEETLLKYQAFYGEAQHFTLK